MSRIYELRTDVKHDFLDNQLSFPSKRQDRFTLKGVPSFLKAVPMLPPNNYSPVTIH